MGPKTTMTSQQPSTNPDSTILAVPKLRDDGSNWSDYYPRIQNAMGAVECVVDTVEWWWFGNGSSLTCCWCWSFQHVTWLNCWGLAWVTYFSCTLATFTATFIWHLPFFRTGSKIQRAMAAILATTSMHQNGRNSSSDSNNSSSSSSSRARDVPASQSS